MYHVKMRSRWRLLCTYTGPKQSLKCLMTSVLQFYVFPDLKINYWNKLSTDFWLDWCAQRIYLSLNYSAIFHGKFNANDGRIRCIHLNWTEMLNDINYGYKLYWTFHVHVGVIQHSLNSSACEENDAFQLLIIKEIVERPKTAWFTIWVRIKIGIVAVDITFG